MPGCYFPAEDVPFVSVTSSADEAERNHFNCIHAEPSLRSSDDQQMNIRTRLSELNLYFIEGVLSLCNVLRSSLCCSWWGWGGGGFWGQMTESGTLCCSQRPVNPLGLLESAETQLVTKT